MTANGDPVGKGGKPHPPETTRRAEVEEARRTPPVQVFRARIKTLTDDDQAIKAMAEALRGLLHRK